MRWALQGRGPSSQPTGSLALAALALAAIACGAEPSARFVLEVVEIHVASGEMHVARAVYVLVSTSA